MRRFRRKPRVVWLPQPGIVSFLNPTDDIMSNNSGFDFTFALSEDEPTTVSTPLVLDNPTSNTVIGASMAVLDAQGLNLTQTFGYRLRRIVGKIFVSAGFQKPTTQDTIRPAVLVSAGIIVRRVDESGAPTAAGKEQDVNSIQNNPDPWVWRRDWILGCSATNNNDFVDSLFGAPPGGATNGNINTFPPNNCVGYGSVKDGPHIDQKTARVVGPEERLFLNLTGWTLPFNGRSPFTPNVNPSVYVNMQYRVLGSIRTNQGNRRNSSR